MKIAIKFDDDEYMTLAKELLKSGVYIPLNSWSYGDFPVEMISKSSPPSLYINIKNPIMTKDIMNYAMKLMMAGTDPEGFQKECRDRFGKYFEMNNYTYYIKVKHRKRKHLRKKKAPV